jgi:hypothetical protein
MGGWIFLQGFFVRAVGADVLSECEQLFAVPMPRGPVPVSNRDALRERSLIPWAVVLASVRAVPFLFRLVHNMNNLD